MYKREGRMMLVWALLYSTDYIVYLHSIDTHIIIALWLLPAIHWTLRIYKLLLTCLSNSSHWAALTLSAAWMVWICVETAESTASSRRLNSSKHPQAPHLTRPMNILPIDFTSMPSSQLNTSTCVSDLHKKNSWSESCFYLIQLLWILFTNLYTCTMYI